MTNGTRLDLKTIGELTTWFEDNSKTIMDIHIYDSEPVIETTTTTGNITTTEHTFPNTTTVINVSEGTGIAPELTVEVKSLVEQPEIKIVPLSESAGEDNIWYVDSFESLKDACGTSRIVYKGNTLMMNVCESEGKSKVDLIVAVDGDIKHIPFILENSCNNTSNHDMILSI